MKKLSTKQARLPRTETPSIYADRLERLKPDELAQIRSFLSSPVWARFLRVVACKKPSSNVANAGSTARDEFSDARANARLGEIRGWELYEFAIFLALSEPKEIKKEIEATYPDSGTMPLQP